MLIDAKNVHQISNMGPILIRMFVSDNWYHALPVFLSASGTCCLGEFNIAKHKGYVNVRLYIAYGIKWTQQPFIYLQTSKQSTAILESANGRKVFCHQKPLMFFIVMQQKKFL